MKIVGVLSDAHVVPVEGSLNGSAAVELVRERLETAMKEADLEVSAVVALGSEEPPDHEAGLQRLSGALFEALPDAARMEAARALIHAPGPRREVANRIVKICSTIALTVGLAPIPLSDAVVIAPLQVVMVSAIAHLGGRPWDRKAAAEWIGSMGVVGGAGLGFRWTAQQLAKLIPGAGSVRQRVGRGRRARWRSVKARWRIFSESDRASWCRETGTGGRPASTT